MFRRVPGRYRVLAAFLGLGIVAFFFVGYLAAAGRVDLGRVLDPCGFRQRYGLPCPTCGMTRSWLVFSRGAVAESFYVQPAGALLCCILAVAAFLALLAAVFGLHFRFLDSLYSRVRAGYVVLVLMIVIAAGWAVTLARALAARARS